jgi:hypothetical protein
MGDSAASALVTTLLFPTLLRPPMPSILSPLFPAFETELQNSSNSHRCTSFDPRTALACPTVPTVRCSRSVSTTFPTRTPLAAASRATASLYRKWNESPGPRVVAESSSSYSNGESPGALRQRFESGWSMLGRFRGSCTMKGSTRALAVR